MSLPLLASSYSRAGSVEYFARQSGQVVNVISQHNSYYHWSTDLLDELLPEGGGDTPDLTVVTFGFSRDKLAAQF